MIIKWSITDQHESIVIVHLLQTFPSLVGTTLAPLKKGRSRLGPKQLSFIN